MVNDDIVSIIELNKDQDQVYFNCILYTVQDDISLYILKYNVIML